MGSERVKQEIDKWVIAVVAAMNTDLVKQFELWEVTEKRRT